MGRNGSKRVKMGMSCLSDEQAGGSTRTVSNMVSPDMYTQVLEDSKKLAKKEEERRTAEEAARKKKEEDDVCKAIQASLSKPQLP